MRHYIRAGKVDDLRREKAEWQMKYDARKQLYNDQEHNYDRARWNWKDSVVDMISKTFSSYISKLPDLDIRVDDYYYGADGIQISLKYEHLFNEKFSLNWSYTISMTSNGEIEKETSSWSGFNATTSEQIDDLMNSADFLRAIVDFDWAPLLSEAKSSSPKYSNYVGIKDPRYDPDYKDPGYDKMIKDAEVEEALSSGRWIKVLSNYGYNKWMYIISETPKFYTYTTVNEYEITHATPENTNIERLTSRILDPVNQSSYYTDKVKKDKLVLTTPIETKTSDELVAMIGTAAQQ